MHPGIHAATSPDHPAVIMADTGETVSYQQLDERSTQLAHLFAARGLGAGDHIAVLVDNHPAYFEIVWAALRSGIYVTPINWHLGPGEAGYIVEDCGARALVAAARFGELLTQIEPHCAHISIRLALGGEVAGFESYEAAVASMPSTPLTDEVDGAIMFYSSGTTGRPKGIKPPLRHTPFGETPGLAPLLTWLYQMSAQSRYLSPAPLYHAAPLVWSTSAQRIGATVVVTEGFDAEGVLKTIQDQHVTHAQFVPTHFVRMLKLPAEVRARYDHSSLEMVVHAAAPCPIEVKRSMIEWWGPIVHEYYAGSEGIGYCAVTAEEWLAHEGTVGRPVAGQIHIVGSDNVEVPVGETGQIWFETGAVFEYHNDPNKTQEAFNDRGWSTLGDIGHLDEEGYLYLTDRASHMIISGGVNIYPQEVENLLVTHPAVGDVAVIGVPDEEFGESVLAVVEVADDVAPTDELATELIEFCRANLARFKCPRRVEFIDELPRLPTGKLLKRVVREHYGAPPTKG